MMVILLPASDQEPTFQPAVLGDLLRMGISSVRLVGDGRILGVVVEGWGFDPRRSAGAVLGTLGNDEPRGRILHQIAEVAVAPAPLPEGQAPVRRPPEAPPAPGGPAPD
jgi:hypothetical protein